MEITGIYLDNIPIQFEEGGVPALLEWQRWLKQRGYAKVLRLLLNTSERKRPIVLRIDQHSNAI